jgi:hypothetical protein
MPLMLLTSAILIGARGVWPGNHDAQYAQKLIEAIGQGIVHPGDTLLEECSHLRR